MDEKKIIKTILIISGVLLLFSFISPYIFTHFTSNIDFSGTGEIGDTIGGIMNPFLSIVAILITFLAFYIQYSANKLQVSQLKDMKIEQTNVMNKQHFFKIVDNLNTKITSFKTKNNQGYEAINQIINELKQERISQCFQLGRIVLCYHPELVPDSKWSELENRININSRNQMIGLKEVNNLKDVMIKMENNERWEFLKIYIKSNASDNYSDTNGIVESIATINFYNIRYDTKLFVYENSFQKIEKKYSGFINSYFKNLLFLLKFISNNTDEFYIDYLKGNISLQELVLSFYYSASSKNSLEFREYLKDSEMLNELLNHRDYFIDIPNKTQLKSEIKNILNKTV